MSTHTKISHLVTSLSTSRQQVVFALLVTSCQQVWNKLLTICNNLVDIIRLVTRLFQQVRYSHDIAVLLQPCVVNLVAFLFIMTVSDLLEQPCDKSDNSIKLARCGYTLRVTSQASYSPEYITPTQKNHGPSSLLLTSY
jgi:hypothetical protein